MSVDTSVRNTNSGGQRAADALLRATGGTMASLLVPPALGDASDAGQLGINAPQFQQLPLSPALFRRTRASMQEGEEPKFELLLSATSIQQQVTVLQLSSADALFAMTAGVVVSGGHYQIEGWSSSESLGQAYLYRLLLRAAHAESLTSLL